MGNKQVSALLLIASSQASVAMAADLTDLSFESLLETRVTSASKYEQTLVEVPAAVSVITRDEIRAYGWRTLAQALASLPGIHGSYDRQYEYLGTRGFGLPGDFNTRLLLAIDGNRINDVVYDGAALGRTLPLDLDLVERIEFIPGPGGAVYGQNAMFGVINVITRNGLQVDGWESTASWQGPQDTGEARLRWGRRFANGSDVLVSLAAMRSDGDDLFLDFPGAALDGSTLGSTVRGLDGETDDEFMLHLGHGNWNFEAMYGSRVKDDPTGAYFSDPLAPGQYERDDYTLAHLRYQRDTGPAWNLRGRLYTGRQSYSGLFQYAGAPNFSSGISEWHGGELRLLHTGIAGHKLMVGVEAQDNTRIDQSAVDLSTVAVGLKFPVTAPVDIQRDGYRVGLYAQDEWQISERVSTSLGLRVDRNDSTGTRPSPRAALIWTATPALTLKTIYGRANRAPNSYERDYGDDASLVANPHLGRESIDTLEFVAEGPVGRALNLRASAYRWHMHELVMLDIDPASGMPQYRSGGKVEARGAEFSASAAWNGGKRLRASLSWQDVTYASSGARPANSPEWLARVNYMQPLGRSVELGLELQYDAERRANDGSKLDDYWLANLNFVASTPISGLDLSLALLNLFDTDYAHPAADSNWQDRFAQDGRSIRLRMDYRF